MTLFLVTTTLILSVFLLQYLCAYLHPNYIIYDKKTKNYYLIFNDTYCEIYDYNTTIHSLGFNIDQVSEVSNIKSIKKYKENDKLNCPIYFDWNCTESDCDPNDQCYNFRLKILRQNQILTNNVSSIKSVTNIGPYFNPSIISFNNKLLMSYRTAFEEQNILSMKRDFSNKEDINYAINSSNLDNTEDIRLFELSKSRVILTFTYFYVRYYYIAFKYLTYDRSSQTYNLTSSVKLEYENMSSYEKNWTPFIYNESLYYIYRVLPLEVIHFTDYYYIPKNRYYHTHGFLSVKMNLTSIDSCSKMNYKGGLSWSYGKIRGGTPLYLIQDIGYFGFFHSLLFSCDYNYFFGAYIISSEPPFKVIKMSHQPIISNKMLVMHTGNQYKSVIFPMSYYMLDHDKKILDTKQNIYSNNISTIVVSAGYDDSVGYIIHLDFKMLLNSMTDMVDSC